MGERRKDQVWLFRPEQSASLVDFKKDSLGSRLFGEKVISFLVRVQKNLLVAVASIIVYLIGGTAGSFSLFPVARHLAPLCILSLLPQYFLQDPFFNEPICQRVLPTVKSLHTFANMLGAGISLIQLFPNDKRILYPGVCSVLGTMHIPFVDSLPPRLQQNIVARIFPFLIFSMTLSLSGVVLDWFHVREEDSGKISIRSRYVALQANATVIMVRIWFSSRFSNGKLLTQYSSGIRAYKVSIEKAQSILLKETKTLIKEVGLKNRKVAPAQPSSMAETTQKAGESEATTYLLLPFMAWFKAEFQHETLGCKLIGSKWLAAYSNFLRKPAVEYVFRASLLCGLVASFVGTLETYRVLRPWSLLALFGLLAQVWPFFDLTILRKLAPTFDLWYCILSALGLTWASIFLLFDGDKDGLFISLTWFVLMLSVFASDALEPSRARSITAWISGCCLFGSGLFGIVVYFELIPLYDRPVGLNAASLLQSYLIMGSNVWFHSLRIFMNAVRGKGRTMAMLRAPLGTTRVTVSTAEALLEKEEVVSTFLQSIPTTDIEK